MEENETVIETQTTEEEQYLVYNMWIENMTINATTVILQTGQSTSPPPKPPGT